MNAGLAASSAFFCTSRDEIDEKSESNPLIFPSEQFKNKANIQSFDLFEEAKQDRNAFWANQAKHLHWFQTWDRVLEWDPPYAKWFVGAKLNACYNCLDRHMTTKLDIKLRSFGKGKMGRKPH